MLGSGMTESDILAEFPYLKAGDLRAAQLYAARLTDCSSVLCGKT